MTFILRVKKKKERNTLSLGLFHFAQTFFSKTLNALLKRFVHIKIIILCLHPPPPPPPPPPPLPPTSSTIPSHVPTDSCNYQPVWNKPDSYRVFKWNTDGGSYVEQQCPESCYFNLATCDCAYKPWTPQNDTGGFLYSVPFLLLCFFSMTSDHTHGLNNQEHFNVKQQSKEQKHSLP